jgi:hypothetical protein
MLPNNARWKFLHWRKNHKKEIGKYILI